MTHDASHVRVRRHLLIAGDDAGATDEAATLAAASWHIVVRRAADDVLGDAALADPDLVLVDERAGTMSGIELVEALRERFARYIPALLMTSDPQGTRSALLGGFDGVVTKPVDAERLHEALRYVSPK